LKETLINKIMPLFIEYLNEIFHLFVMMAPFLMLGFLISGVLFLITSKEMVARNIGKPGILSILKASLLGVPMPLCSCGVIPVSSSLYNRGASKASTLSFLISTPQTGVDSIFITYSMLGLPFAICRPIIALITGTIGGIITEMLTENDVQSQSKIAHKHNKKTIIDGLNYAMFTLPKDIAWPLIKGILLAGLVTLILPNNFFSNYGLTGIIGLVAIALVSIPMYTCATASVPFAAALMHAGAEPGVAFVFLMAGPATNVATITVIKKILGRKVVSIYLGVIFIGSIFFGLIINQFININSIPVMKHHAHHMDHLNFITISSSIVLFILCMIAISDLFKSKNSTTSNLVSNGDVSLIVKGMTCNHCKETVHEAIINCKNIDKATIDLTSGRVEIYGKNINSTEIIEAITKVGFSIGKII
jgi:uncharacterized membrane protein YraQ (UPF0718 family)/copper chaperone CopZ